MLLVIQGKVPEQGAHVAALRKCILVYRSGAGFGRTDYTTLDKPKKTRHFVFTCWSDPSFGADEISNIRTIAEAIGIKDLEVAEKA